jgi:hypothetical protein
MATIRSFAASYAQRPGDLPTRSALSVVRTTVAIFAAGIVLLFVARRLAGAFSEPPPIGAYLLLGLVFAAAAVLVRRELATAVSRTSVSNGWICCGGSIVAIVGGVSVSLPSASVIGLLLLWLPIALEEGWAWRQWMERRGPTAIEAPPLTAATSVEPDAEVIALDSAVAELAFADTTITQHLVRRREHDGGESISGYLRAAFMPGQRIVNLHVPFCPPIAIIPSCGAETINGAPARVKVSQVLPQGARLEVKLDQVSTEPQQVVIEFSASNPPGQGVF